MRAGFKAAACCARAACTAATLLLAAAAIAAAAAAGFVMLAAVTAVTEGLAVGWMAVTVGIVMVAVVGDTMEVAWICKDIKMSSV